MEYDQGGGEVKRVHNSIAVGGGMGAAMLAQFSLPFSLGVCRTWVGQTPNAKTACMNTGEKC